MKILIAGQFKSWALEHHYTRYLAPYAQVETYPAEDVFDDFYHRSVFNKIRFRLGLSSIEAKIGRALIAKAENLQPDAIWIFKGMRIQPSVLGALKSKGFFLANYNPDHPFIFSSRGSGNANVAGSVGLYDLHFCYSSKVQRQIERQYGIFTASLPFGYELSEAAFKKAGQAQEILRACFIGNPDPIRVGYLKALVKNGIPLDVYGHGWEKHLRASSRLHIYDAVYKEYFWEKIRAYRVQINIFRPHNEGSHNMRSFEIPAVGGIMLAPDSPEHQQFFTAGEEAFFYKNEAELIDWTKRILSFAPAEAIEVRRKARQKSLEAGYDYEHRAAHAARVFAERLAANAHPALSTLMPDRP